MVSWLESDITEFGERVTKIGTTFISKGYDMPSNLKTIYGTDKEQLVPFEEVTIPASVEIIGAFTPPRGIVGNLSIGGEAFIPLLEEPTCLFDSSTVINGYYGTAAHDYALDWNLKFNPLDDILYGDANTDGEINIADMVLLRRYILHNEEVGYEADLNKDGKIDVFDMIGMRNELISK